MFFSYRLHSRRTMLARSAVAHQNARLALGIQMPMVSHTLFEQRVGQESAQARDGCRIPAYLVARLGRFALDHAQHTLCYIVSSLIFLSTGS